MQELQNVNNVHVLLVHFALWVDFAENLIQYSHPTEVVRKCYNCNNTSHTLQQEATFVLLKSAL